jgi:H+/Cl- antiporter ClcA
LIQAGKYIFFFGIILAIAGGILWLFGNKFSWFGNLPGDVKVEKENFKFYFPVTTMILASIVLSLLLWVVRKFLK